MKTNALYCREVRPLIRVVGETTDDLTNECSSLYREKYKLGVCFFLSITVRIRVHSNARETEPATKEQTLKSKIFFCVFIKRCSDGFAKHDELRSADHAILNQNLYIS